MELNLQTLIPPHPRVWMFIYIVILELVMLNLQTPPLPLLRFLNIFVWKSSEMVNLWIPPTRSGLDKFQIEIKKIYFDGVPYPTWLYINLDSEKILKKIP